MNSKKQYKYVTGLIYQYNKLHDSCGLMYGKDDGLHFYCVNVIVLKWSKRNK